MLPSVPEQNVTTPDGKKNTNRPKKPSPEFRRGRDRRPIAASAEQFYGLPPSFFISTSSLLVPDCGRSNVWEAGTAKVVYEVAKGIALRNG